jgi:hypothetical protein
MTKRTSSGPSTGSEDVHDPGHDGTYVQFVDANWTGFLRLARFLSGEDRAEDLLQDCLGCGASPASAWPEWPRSSP